MRSSLFIRLAPRLGLIHALLLHRTALRRSASPAHAIGEVELVTALVIAPHRSAPLRVARASHALQELPSQLERIRTGRDLSGALRSARELLLASE